MRSESNNLKNWELLKKEFCTLKIDYDPSLDLTLADVTLQSALKKQVISKLLGLDPDRHN